MILYETINTRRIPSRISQEELGSSDELYSSEALALMSLASYCPLDERDDPSEWGFDRLPYPFFASGEVDDDNEEGIDEDDDFDDLDDDDDFDDDFDDEDEDYDDDDGYYDDDE
ncbi:MAG: hypothetical protein LBD55_05650 [Treponema sp.]|nr:hypothetical protein [Treponema sp.]